MTFFSAYLASASLLRPESDHVNQHSFIDRLITRTLLTLLFDAFLIFFFGDMSGDERDDGGGF